MKTLNYKFHFLSSLLLLVSLCASGSADQKIVSKIAIKTFDGHYLSAEGGGGREVVANRTAIGAWETFTLIRVNNVLSGNDWALQAANGQYVSAEDGGGGAVVANRTVIDSWETFHMRFKGTGFSQTSLETANGHYLCAEGGGGGALVANRDTAREWETFALIFDVVPQAQIRPPQLRSPAPGAVLKNGCTNFQVGTTNTFTWSSVPGAGAYQIYVKHRGAVNPVVDQNVFPTESNRTQNTDVSYSVVGSSWVADPFQTGWTWKVRAYVNNKDQAWSEERPFQFERVNTNPACR